ncbi:glycosyltransferase 87 family protein [Pseudonocardia sp.]|uniref:glycosyltransferase 87 family protein n=1 Tax=Pseudonocardia sp. TaxID=60912 RepID=UPI002F420D9B
MTAVATLRERTGQLGGVLRDRPRWIFLVTLPVLVAVAAGYLVSLQGHFLDLEVYRLGVHAWLTGGDIYGTLPVTSAGVVLPFIYPPFAAVLMVPLTVTGWVVAWVALSVLSLACLAATMYLTVRRLWPRGARLAALAVTSGLVPLCFALEPVRQTFLFGQINLILMAMVAADCLVVRTRWPRGALVGLATAIKLTPGAFLLYFVLRRDYRSAVISAVSAAAATGVGALVAPAASRHYWLDGLAGASGVSGSPFFTNQTFQAVFSRAGVGGLEMKVCWLALSVGLVLLAAPAIRRAPAALAMVATAGVGLLVSPTSWSHHWVWIAPALLIAGVSAWRAGSTLWAAVTGVLAVVFVVAPHQYLPHDHGLELAWSVPQQVLGASYVIVTVAVYVLLWRNYRAPAAGRGAV